MADREADREAGGHVASETRGPLSVRRAEGEAFVPLPYRVFTPAKSASCLSLSPSLSLSPPPVTLTPPDTGRTTWRAPGGGFTAFPGGQARSD